MNQKKHAGNTSAEQQCNKSGYRLNQINKYIVLATNAINKNKNLNLCDSHAIQRLFLKEMRPEFDCGTCFHDAWALLCGC